MFQRKTVIITVIIAIGTIVTERKNRPGRRRVLPTVKRFRTPNHDRVLLLSVVSHERSNL